MCNENLPLISVSSSTPQPIRSHVTCVWGPTLSKWSFIRSRSRSTLWHPASISFSSASLGSSGRKLGTKSSVAANTETRRPSSFLTWLNTSDELKRDLYIDWASGRIVVILSGVKAISSASTQVEELAPTNIDVAACGEMAIKNCPTMRIVYFGSLYETE